MLHDFFFVGLGLIKILRVFKLVSVHDLFQIICLINDNSQFVVDTQYIKSSGTLTRGYVKISTLIYHILRN